MNRKQNYFFTILLVILPFYSYAQSPDDPFLGDYEGIFTGPEKKINERCVAEVFPLGNNEYFIHFLAAFNSRADEYVRTTGSLSNRKIIFNNEVARGEISHDSLTGELFMNGGWIGFKLKNVERSSPTEGAKPTKDAIVLFDGSGFSEWTGISDSPVKWKIVNGNEMEVVPAGPKIQPTHIFTRRKFTDLFLHLEFKLSLMPGSRGQQRCNSGMIFSGLCEVQILDSYGLEGSWRECGALYRNSPPKVNMCFPPLRWQTYDVIIHAPRYDQNGKRVKDAEITVFHNGKRIHYQYPIQRGPDQLEKGHTDFPFTIQLQDHNDVLWFRNIWAIDLTVPDLPEFVNNLRE